MEFAEDTGNLIIDLTEWTLVDTFNVVDTPGTPFEGSRHGLWHVCDVELTEDSYTMTRIMRYEPGDYDTHVLPDSMS